MNKKNLKLEKIKEKKGPEMKRQIIKALKEFWKDEEGQTSTEYILMVAIVVMIIMRFRKELETRISGLIEKTFASMDSVVSGPK